MPLTPGTRIGPYEVTGSLGEGGMGEVYRATDTNLGRQVALKVLPAAVADDPDRLARFEREARTLATLNHPNIAAIYGLQRAEGQTALVMELVEGQTLAEIISGETRGAPAAVATSGAEEQPARGGGGPRALSVDEALPIARQIAQALEAAHDRGIVHRDLKPGNVMLTDDGTVKVLDFGLAKVGGPAAADLENSPTISMAATQAGVILGTAAYMAPEQARGKVVDKRADIWAFGVVLYEMVTGRKPFEGEDLTETLAAVVKSEPDLDEAPPTLRRLLRKCLEKDPRKRLRDISGVELLLEIRESGSAPEAATVRPLTQWLLWAVAALAIAAAAVPLLRRDPPADPPPEMRLELTTPPTQDATAFAISPDGRQLAFVATVDRRSVLFVRSLESGRTRVLEGTAGASSPFWSPDGRSLAFRAGGSLKRIELERGSIQTLAGVALTFGGGAWGPSGDILFPPLGPTGIVRIRDNGGPGEAVTRVQPLQTFHGDPLFLPDGEHFLFTAQSGAANVAGIYLARLGDLEARPVLGVASPAAYVDGKLLFVQEGSLFAQPFDLDTLTVSGSPEAISDRVRAFSASGAGTIVIRGPLEETDARTSVLTWFDRSGQEQTLGGPGGTSPSLSPDGTRLVVFRTTDGNEDLWIIDLERDTQTRFTSFAGPDLHPRWSPDGSRIVFSSVRDAGRLTVYEKAVSGGEEHILYEASGAAMVSDWSDDGAVLLLRAGGLNDLWALPMDGSGEAFPWLESEFSARDGKFSPDGRWVAYASDESGRFEIYLRSFPQPGRKFPVSTDGGVWPEWRGDGAELFYVGLDNRMMAVPIELDPTADPRIGTPTALFTAPFRSLIGVDPQQYVVSPDGQRFLASVAVDETPPPLTVILNWGNTPSP